MAGSARSFKHHGQRQPIHRKCRTSLFAVIPTLFAALAVVGCAGDDGAIPEIEQKFEDVPGFEFKLPCPVAVFSPEYLFASEVPRDGIPSIDEPTFSPASAVTWLADDDRVLGIIFGGEPLAIPIRIMVWHEAVNITGISGRVSVTYCPLTFSGITLSLESTFPGETQSLGVSGLLYNSNLVLYDRKTGSLWTQMSGSAYVGASAGSCLNLIPTTDTTFQLWTTLHPDTKVLDRPGKPAGWQQYEINTYEDYWANDEVLYPIRQPLDSRLAAKTWVLGVLADTGEKAFPIDNAPVTNDSLPGVPFVVFTMAAHKTAVAYKAWDGDGELLTFSFVGPTASGPTYADDQTGSTWNFKGECIDGPLSGSALEMMPSYLAFYFAWWSHFPETLVYAPSE